MGGGKWERTKTNSSPFTLNTCRNCPGTFFLHFFKKTKTKKKLFIYFQGLSFLSVCLNSVCKNVCGVELQLHYWAPSSKLRGSGIIREDGRGERGGGWGLVQSTPLSKATCAATHSIIHEEEEKQKEKQVAPGINSQLLFSSFHCSVSSPFLALWHMAGYFLLKLAVQIKWEEMIDLAEGSLSWLYPHNANKELTWCVRELWGQRGVWRAEVEGSAMFFVSSNLKVTSGCVQSSHQWWRGGWRWEGGGCYPAWGTLSHTGCHQSCSGSPLDPT